MFHFERIESMPFTFVRGKALETFRKGYRLRREENGYPTVERVVKGVWLGRYDRPVCFWLKFFFRFGGDFFFLVF